MGQKQELDWADFPSLIRSIAERDHDGVVMRMAEELDVSTALLNQWVHGLVKHPSTKNLYKLSQRYAIPFMDLVAVVAQRREDVPMGKASRRQGRRTAGSLLLAFAVGSAAALGWPSLGRAAEAHPLPVGPPARLVADPYPHPLLLAKCPPLLDIMSTWRLLAHRLWCATSGWTSSLAGA